MAKKIYVLDTSAYLTDYRVIYSYGSNDIIVPLIVLEELDKCKMNNTINNDKEDCFLEYINFIDRL